MLKAKCGVAETRNRSPETKILNHETETDHLDVQLTGLDTTLRQFEHEKEELRHQIEIFEEILIGYQVIKLQIMAQCRAGSINTPICFSYSGDEHNGVN